MNCSLWMNGVKVNSAEDIIKNYDAASVRGYFLGGSLCKWLRSHGGENIALKLEQISPDVSGAELNDALARAFGQKCCTAEVHKCDERLIRLVDEIRGMGGLPAGSFGRFGSGSYSHRREWEWEYRLGSFRRVSGSFGSFAWQGGSFVRLGGSFAGSYKGFGGSFAWLGRLGSFGSYGSSGSFGAIGVIGSYKGFAVAGDFGMTAEEYDRIMYRCLKICPLNRYGYGIHLIHG